MGIAWGFDMGTKREKKARKRLHPHNLPRHATLSFSFVFSSDNDSHYRSSQALSISLSQSLSLSNYPMLPSCPFSESELHMVMIDSIHSPTTFPLTILHSIFVNHKLYLEKGISAAFILLQVFTIFSFCSHLHHARVCRFRKIPTIGGKVSPPSSPSLYSYEPLHLISSPSNS